MKYNYPKRKAIYSIQFWYDEKEEVLKMTETANDSNALQDSASMYVFGALIAKSNLLDKKDKFSFKEFCRSYLANYEDES